MQRAWQEPLLLETIENIPPGRTDLARQCVYLNFYFMYLRMCYRNNTVTSAEIEDLAAHSFSTPAGKFYWTRVGEHMRTHFEKGFTNALNVGYARAQAKPEGFFLDNPNELDTQLIPPHDEGVARKTLGNA